MKKGLSLLMLSTACLVGQSLDFSSLDKLEAKAKEATRVVLDENQLRAVTQMMLTDKSNQKDMEAFKKLVAGLTSVTIRSLEFSKAGQYQDSDLTSIRAQFANLKGWAKIIDTKEENEHAEIYMLTEGDKSKGMAVMSQEPTELSVVFIKGTVNLGDLGSLGALANLPVVSVGPNRNAVSAKK